MRDYLASKCFNALQRRVNFLDAQDNPVCSLTVALFVDLGLDQVLLLDEVKSTRELGVGLAKYRVNSLMWAGWAVKFPTESGRIECLATRQISSWDLQMADVASLQIDQSTKGKTDGNERTYGYFLCVFRH